ncbi:hypothetical protein D9Q98_008485 [Chlorella vulgaris]|uniref:Uncharacterized protein n=1 Tax=Chlorella vulgaris TaxID=3077 RepID=A0A9D4YU49_CHLVU|nr:hypothetical protein D9Q98_008485 [Chlorella vulgaris]
MQQQPFPTYQPNPWVPSPTPEQQQHVPQQPQLFVPHQSVNQQPMGGMGQPVATSAGYGMPQGYGAPSVPMAGSGFGGGGAAGMDPFLTGVAGNMLRQQGQSYLQRGQAFMQSKMGFLSGSSLHYHFSINPEYVRSKLAMLAAPFLRRWSYVRVAEQISGGHKYLPPRQDVNAPDLYIPLMAIWTYCLLIGAAALARSGPSGGGFKPEIIYNSVSSSGAAWLLHTLLLKLILGLLGIAGAVPMLELAAYAGYPFVAACTSLLAQLAGGGTTYHAVWAYGSLCMAVLLVRSLKRVILQEARTYSIDNSRHNYLLLGLAIFQFPLNAWLARLPPGAAGAAGKAGAAAGKAAARAFF